MIRRLLPILVLVAACVATLMFTGASDEESKGRSYVIELDSAFGLTEGGEVRVGGVRAGSIEKFKLDEEADPVKALVTVEITKPGFQRFTTEASCEVRQQSLIGEYFIDCQPGKGGKELASGGRVPVERNSSTIPVDLVNNIMRLPYRERFRILISQLGAGLAGRPDELNEVIRRAHPGLREASQTFEILADHNRIIRDFITNADRVSAAVEPRKNNLTRWAKEASETATIQASRRDDLARQWNRLPAFLAELEPTAKQLEQTAGRQVILLRELQDAAPALRNFLEELEPFAAASRPSLRALGQMSVTGRGTLVHAREEVRELRRLARDAPRLGKPLRQFLQTVDDRTRSIENDPEAGRAAPPAPDKTAYREGQGFTGMEAFLNYIYWQALAINGFDDVSHFLRILLIQHPTCSRYFTNPTEEQRRECGNRMGPSAPGLYGQPDPTADGTAAREASQPRKKVGPRGAGEPEAPPIPGQRDPSKPHVVLPPGVQDLLGQLQGGGAGGAQQQATPGDPTMDALDFLLAP